MTAGYGQHRMAAQTWTLVGLGPEFLIWDGVSWIGLGGRNGGFFCVGL
jgi:hypothetical protein